MADKEHSSYPDPEQTALTWALRLNTLLHTRLNYWLVTEGILFAAYTAIADGAEERWAWMILYILTWAGFFFTFIWQATLMRAWIWFDWYYKRLEAIHCHRYGRPANKNDVTSLGVFPPEKQFSFWSGHGLDIRVGSVIMATAFSTIWVVLQIASADKLWGLEGYPFYVAAASGGLLLVIYASFLVKTKPKP